MSKKTKTIKAWAVIDVSKEIQFPDHKDGFARIFKTRKGANDNIYQREIGEKAIPVEIKPLK